MPTLNVSVGVLGHVDSGKTSLGEQMHKLKMVQITYFQQLITATYRPEFPIALHLSFETLCVFSCCPVHHTLYCCTRQASAEQGARHHAGPRLLLLHSTSWPAAPAPALRSIKKHACLAPMTPRASLTHFS
jgi:hypothetical protein